MKRLLVLIPLAFVIGCPSVPKKAIKGTEQFDRVVREDYVKITQPLLLEVITKLKSMKKNADSESIRAELQKKIDKYTKAYKTGEEIGPTFDSLIKMLKEFN